MRLKRIISLASFMSCVLFMPLAGFADGHESAGSGIGYGMVFAVVAIFIGAVGVSQMKYRDKCIFIFIAIISVGTVPTISAYYANMSLIPKNTITITASRYNFDVSGDAKVGEPTKINVVATDVTHSAFIKELGVNLQALPGKNETPGRDNWTIIIPKKPGTYKIQCTEYCGEGHGSMSTDLAGEFVVKP